MVLYRFSSTLVTITLLVGSFFLYPGSLPVLANDFTVSINQSATQADPTEDLLTKFEVVFGQAIDVTTFTPEVVDLAASTAPGVQVESIEEVAPGDATTFELTIRATGAGTVVPVITEGRALDVSNISLGSGNIQPYGITADNAGNIFTANNASKDVTRITPDGAGGYTTSRVALHTTSPLPAPDEITTDAAGNVYTMNPTSDDITKLVPNGAGGYDPIEIPISPEGSRSRTIALDQTGTIYTASSFILQNMVRLTPDSGDTYTRDAFNLHPEADKPYGIAVDASGAVFTANEGSDDVTKFTPDGAGGYTAGRIPLNPEAQRPWNVEVDSVGNVYTVNIGSGDITKLVPDGSGNYSAQRIELHAGAASPFDIFVDAEDTLYTANYNSRDITVVSLDRNNQYQAKGYSLPAGLDRPNGITVSDGDIFVSTQLGNGVAKITLPAGVLSSDRTLANTASIADDNIVTITDETTDLDGDGVLDRDEYVDSNGDGELDILQSQVATVALPDADRAVLESESCVISRLGLADREMVANVTLDYDYPLGLFDFALNCQEPGRSEVVRVIFDQVYDVTEWEYHKYKNGSYLDISEVVSYETVLVDSVEKTVATYTIQDGGPLDADGETNGVILDPAGPAVVVPANETVEDSTEEDAPAPTLEETPNSELPTNDLALIRTGGYDR